MLDERILKVTIDLDGEKHEFERLAITAIGMKHASAIQNNAEIRIANIDKGVRDTLLSEGTPFNATCPKNSILIEAGRVSTGLSVVYEGDITTVNITQPPDIWLTMNALTGQKRKQETVALGLAAKTQFSAIAKQVALRMGVALDFRAPDKEVANYSYSGAVGKLVGTLSTVTEGVDAFIDDGVLIVRDRNDPKPKATTPISLSTGLIGIPKFVDFGVSCTVLMDQRIELGDDIDLASEAYPAVNGVYNIYRLGFNLANRDTPFYYNIEATRLTPIGCNNV